MLSTIDQEDLVWAEAREEIIMNNPISDAQLEQEKKILQQMARNTIAKKNIHIGITAHILDKVKRAALRHGMPYQTFINHMLHKHIHEYA